MQYKDPLGRAGIQLFPKYYTPFRDTDPPAWSYRLKRITGINEWRSANLLKTIGRLPLLVEQSRYDIIWQNRLLLPHHAFFERKYRRPLVFDFDDAIWMNEGSKQVARVISGAALVLAGNQWLAEFAGKYNKNVKLVPSVVDTDKLFPLGNPKDHFVLGWIGSPSNFKYLDMIKPALLGILSREGNSSFVVVSSERPSFLNFDDKKIIFRKWTPENENAMINAFSVGLMPLMDTDWEKGKCGYKLLQYLACGKPVIASPVGVNKIFLEEEEIGFTANTTADWLNAFNTLKNDHALSENFGTNGRKFVTKKYSLRTYAPVIAEQLKKLSRG